MKKVLSLALFLFAGCISYCFADAQITVSKSYKKVSKRVGYYLFDCDYNYTKNIMTGQITTSIDLTILEETTIETFNKITDTDLIELLDFLNKIITLSESKDFTWPECSVEFISTSGNIQAEWIIVEKDDCFIYMIKQYHNYVLTKGVKDLKDFVNCLNQIIQKNTENLNDFNLISLN